MKEISFSSAAKRVGKILSINGSENKLFLNITTKKRLINYSPKKTCIQCRHPFKKRGREYAVEYNRNTSHNYYCHRCHKISSSISFAKSMVFFRWKIIYKTKSRLFHR